MATLAGIKPEGEKVSLRAQSSPCYELREKFKCIDYIDKTEKKAETSP